MVIRGLLLVVLLLSGACAGGAGSLCRSDGDCGHGLFCHGPNDPPSCGIPPMQQCATSSDCSGGELCQAIADLCSAQGVGSQCGPRCSACDEGFRCNASGACEPIPCTQGYVCPAYQRCDASAAQASVPVYQQTQGCVNIACASDASCPTATVCVNGSCQSGGGTCREDFIAP